MKTIFIFTLFFANLGWASTNSLIKKAELQWSLCEESADKIVQKLNFAILEKIERQVSYFDDNDLSLFKSGVQIRHRGTLEESQVNSKLKFKHEQDIPWSSLYGKNFKCEADIFGVNKLFSCSMKSDLTESEEWLNQDQVDFVRLRYPSLDRTALKQYGPVRNNVWKLEHSAGELTLEELVLPAGSIYELSFRINERNSSQAASLIGDHIQKSQVSLCPEQRGLSIQVFRALMPSSVDGPTSK